MTLVPGRARLSTRPAPTGSETLVTTIGMELVALLAANAGPVHATTMRSTLRRTRSAARPVDGQVVDPQTATRW